MAASLLLVITLLLFFLNVPIYVATALPTAMVTVLEGDKLIAMPQTLLASLNSFPLMAIPFFILAGSLMEHGGISQKLVDFTNSLVGHYRGGLAYVSIICCIFFAAISGSAIATTAAIGAIMIPAMVKLGYDRAFSAALLAAAGLIGVIIPPSVPMVLYGVGASVSIGKLFMAGIIPGLLVGFSLIAVVYFHTRKYGAGVTEKKSLKEIWSTFIDAAWALLMPVIILGGIYGGIFTPTEASVVAVVYGFLVGIFVYKQITWNVMKKILRSTVLTTSALGLIIATATYFGNWLTLAQVPQAIAALFQEANLGPIVTLMLINLFLLLVGTFMDSSAALIIATPILVPVAAAMGFDLIHFGIIMIVNLAVGLLTPPLGVSLVVAAKVGNTSFESLLRPTMTFLIVLIIDIVLLTVLPQLSIGFANLIDAGNE